MQTPGEILNKQDKAKRIHDEKEILEISESLTNGHAGDAVLEGKVRQWQVKETIAQGVLLRSLVETLADFEKIYQRKTQCILAHQGKRWQVKVFGMTYAVPISTALIVLGGLTYLACRQQGWM